MRFVLSHPSLRLGWGTLVQEVTQSEKPGAMAGLSHWVRLGVELKVFRRSRRQNRRCKYLQALRVRGLSRA